LPLTRPIPAQEQLAAAEVEVDKLEQETIESEGKLNEGWTRYCDITSENELLRVELQTLQRLVRG